MVKEETNKKGSSGSSGRRKKRMAGSNGRSSRSANSQNEFYRGVVQAYIDKQDYETACFWADKMVSMNGGCQQDVYLFAKCLYLCGQYHRAANLLQHYNYERSNVHFRVLTARCLYMAKEYQKALEILDSASKGVQVHRARSSVWEPADPHKTISAQVFLLRGKIHEAMMNRILAAQNYREALFVDIYCVEAFDLLTQHQMLSSSEEIALLESLPFEKCLNNDTEFVKFLYTSKLKKYPFCGEAVQRPTQFPYLAKNLDVLTGEAERHFYNCDFQMSYKVSSQVITEDPYHLGCLPVHVACLVEMKKATELFKVAHKLVEVMSESALAWYSVGAYYFLIGKHEQSRRNLNKALTIDPVFGPAWLLFGHSFATEREHDQAMAAYFKATQLMKGCHLPLLHVGLECGLSNNPQLAMKFLEEAKILAPSDPFILHEMGVVKFNEKKFEEALKLFVETLEFVERNTHSVYLKKWEALYNNMGHCSRKLKKYEDAYRYHQKALLLCPANASTHSAIGLVHAVAGKTEAAIESFHKALSLRRDDAFSTTMLRYCIEKLVEDSNNASDDDIVVSDAPESSDEEYRVSTRYSTRKKSLDTSLSQSQSGSSGRKGNLKTPDGGDMPNYLNWFKESLAKIESGPGGRNSEGPRHTSTPAASEATSRAEKRIFLTGPEESDDRYPITRRRNRGRNSDSSSEPEPNITGTASSSDAEGND